MDEHRHCWHPFDERLTMPNLNYCCRGECKDVLIGECEERTHGVLNRGKLRLAKHMHKEDK